VPEPRCLLKPVVGFPVLNNDQWYVHVRLLVAFWPASEEHHLEIIVIDICVEKCGEYVHVINIRSTSPDRRDEISKGRSLFTRGICLTNDCLIIAFDDEACLVLYRPIGVPLSLEGTSGANRLHRKLLRFCGVDCGEGVV